MPAAQEDELSEYPSLSPSKLDLHHQDGKIVDKFGTRVSVKGKMVKIKNHESNQIQIVETNKLSNDLTVNDNPS